MPAPEIFSNSSRIEKLFTPNPYPFTAFVSRIRVDPSPGEIDDEAFRIVAAFEAIRQAGNAVGTALAIGLPGDLGARAPLLVALVE